MAIMNVLAELHQEHDLKVIDYYSYVATCPDSLHFISCLLICTFSKPTCYLFVFFFSCLLQLNLKFEIEVLCKNLSLDINELKPGNLLKDKEKLKSLEEQLSAPKKEAKPPEEMLPVSTTGGYSIVFFFVFFFKLCAAFYTL